MSVYNSSLTAIIESPVIAHRQAVGIGFTGGFAVKAKLSNAPGRTSLIGFLQSGMSHYQAPIIKNQVADQFINKGRDGLLKILALRLQLLQSLSQPMSNAHITPFELLDQLHIMVAGHAKAGSRLHRRHTQPKYIGHLRAPVYKVTEKNQAPPLGMAQAVSTNYIAEFIQKLKQFIVTAVDVADNVERSFLVLAIVPEGSTHHGSGSSFLRAIQHIDITKTFLFQKAQRLLQKCPVATHHMGAEVSVWTRSISLMADVLGHVENNRRSQTVIFFCQAQQSLSVVRLHIGGIHHSQAPRRQAFINDIVQKSKGLRRTTLVIFIIRNDAPTKIGRNYFSTLKMLPGKSRLTGAGSTNEQHQAQIWQFYLHLVNTPIWVGAPTSLSSSPMG